MTVSELNLKAKILLEAHFENILLSGELSKITFHTSGHWYFELKDEKSSLACAMFKGANSKLDFRPKTGDFLELEGTLSLYTESGRYQFIALNMKKSGFGDLEARFLALKERLGREGLFDEKHKKPLPILPLRVGIISSFTSAALEDMFKIIHQKAYFLAKIYVFNALTQGNSAPSSLIAALKKADEAGLDALILARGGGSREDLFCFNDEGLARAIFALKTPIISAIGHEIDYVISDFVADFRAPTPSAAVHTLFPSRLDLEQSLDHLEQNIKNLCYAKMQKLENEFLSLKKLLRAQSLGSLIEQKLHHNQILLKQLEILMQNKLKTSSLAFEKAKNAFMQHENFFEKSKKLISIKKDGKISNLEDLQSGDLILLSSQFSQKQAKIL